MPKDFLTLADWTAEELGEILARAQVLRVLHRAGERPQTLQGRTLAMYFEKPSLRTHVTFEAGMEQLGGHAVLLRPEQVGIGTRETPRDVALNLSRWVDAIMARTFSHTLIEQLAEPLLCQIVHDGGHTRLFCGQLHLDMGHMPVLPATTLDRSCDSKAA